MKDDVQSKKMDFSREMALRDQTLEFQERRIVELNKSTDDRVQELEHQLAVSKSEKQKQAADMEETFARDKQELESKFE